MLGPARCSFKRPFATGVARGKKEDETVCRVGRLEWATKKTANPCVPHLPILAFLQVLADCVRHGKPRDVDGWLLVLAYGGHRRAKSTCCLHPSALPLSLVQQDPIPQGPAFGSFGGNDSAQTESATPEPVQVR